MPKSRRIPNTTCVSWSRASGWMRNRPSVSTRSLAPRPRCGWVVRTAQRCLRVCRHTAGSVTTPSWRHKEIEMSTDCDDGCEELATQRLRYFTGRNMTARDCADEQKFLQSRRHLHNRVLHGWGIVCGLDVHQHPAGSCRKDHVKVDCGLALDCCGREIPVPKSVVPPPIPWHERPSPVAPHQNAH